MINSIVAFFKIWWKELVKLGKIIFKALLSFKINILSFFKSPERYKKIKENRNYLPFVLREKMKNGDYNVIEGVFDEEKDDLVDIEKETQGFECECLDSELNGHFGNKDLVFLRN